MKAKVEPAKLRKIVKCMSSVGLTVLEMYLGKSFEEIMNVAESVNLFVDDNGLCKKFKNHILTNINQ